MEPNVYNEAYSPEIVTEEENADCKLRSEVTNEPETGIISVQLLEFKTSLLEAVEELHIHRDAEIRYEAQICKLVLEKQELEWQKESLQRQVDRMTNEHSESLATVKKQFQAQVRGIEGDKGKHQLSAELKDKEITSLKEELKLLQLSKYSLEKKLSKLEQKLQLQTQAKDRHLNQLGEVEKRFGAISKQCTLVRQAHEKLEQNVEEAVRLNKKLALINRKQESTISILKRDLERLNSEMVKYKVVSICRSGEEDSHILVKEQQIQELTQKLLVETEVNKKLRNENDVQTAEKQKLMSSLQHAQWLLQVQTKAVCRTEQQLLTHTEEYKVLKREHEMIQERSKEKEDRLMRVIEDYKNSKLTLEKEMQMQLAKTQAVQEELKTVKEAYDHLHEKSQQLPPLEDDTDDNLNIEKNSPSNLNCDLQVITADNLNERLAECQEAAKEDCFHGKNGEASVCSRTNGTILVLPPSQGLGALAADQSESIGGGDALMTNLQIGPVVKQEASVIKTEPVRGTFDNGRPSSEVQSYTDSCLAKLSELETRSVYGVASDPLMSESRDRPEEQSLGVSEMRERQTSDKHTSETSQDTDFKKDEHWTTAPETNSSQSVLPNDSEPILPNISETNPAIQDKDTLNNSQIEREHLDAAHSSLQPNSQEKAIPQVVLMPDTTPKKSNDQISHLQGYSSSRNRSQMHQDSLEDTGKNVEGTEEKSIPETQELNAIASHSYLFCENTMDIIVHSSKDTSANQPESATSAQMSSDPQNADPVPSSLIPNLPKDALSTEILITQSEHLNDEEKLFSDRPSHHDDSKRTRSLFDPSTSQQKTANKPLTYSVTSVPAVLPDENRHKYSDSGLPSGFQEFLTSLNCPLFSKQKLKNRGASVITQRPDELNVSSTHPDQKSNHHGEWNAIKHTFSEISVKKENRVPISFGSAQLGSPAARSVGNGLRHDCTPTPPPRLHSLGKVSRPVSEESPPTSLEKDDLPQSDIRAQIAKIEQYLSSEGFRPEKRRRIEKCEVLKP
ncbi:coiled-coil domain-containing protein 73 isoform X1 [Astyanax mexicanus]|uniref:coiled-coil domain-containing protein 73 isoform X1 n=1 Tax=Astyanax mexicanus TaxID=7994 RepID=UPI0020CB3CE9|nr:coiled-coil domain-containing protein 73 isoform X1 [Astyanax mexicanus]XP_022539549.2 coiled-coil domain-containing protein 73 isoform X1 [Astyanax mexicanus]XP_022539550.2 coiled-coil domain-containing protein 73 isoform X1 [Astyanax mexicanus]XP_022539553.2 coiled-coil domain-containing protein 73 isoform X1 [Astyanax mexicanus]XP_049339953.1 coiled-coil domain-containing protein 73 isoform X1 [Astyanax mexicanus]XP_049339954.1 coiled-coil domain-containing protein 73 isoform X1 [Astyana